MLDLQILILLSAISLVFAPLFFWIRRNMTIQLHKDKPIGYYTKRRVFRFYLFSLLSLIIAFILSLIIIVGIKLRSNVTHYAIEELLIIAFYMLTWLIMGTGFGLYISGVFVEQYSAAHLKELPEYSRLKVATKLLHGRISHVCIYSGGIAIFLLISIFELFNPMPVNQQGDYLIYMLCGLILGIIYYMAQIRNLTWRYQLPFFISFSILAVFISFSGINILSFPFANFFLVFSVTAMTGLLVHWFYKR